MVTSHDDGVQDTDAVLGHVRRLLLFHFFVRDAVDHGVVEALRLLGYRFRAVLLLAQGRIDQAHLREAGRGLFFGLDLRVGT